MRLLDQREDSKQASNTRKTNQPSTFNCFPAYSVQALFLLANNALKKADSKAKAQYREGSRVLLQTSSSYTQTMLKKKKQEQDKII